jgi:hypothetical protein
MYHRGSQCSSSLDMVEVPSSNLGSPTKQQTLAIGGGFLFGSSIHMMRTAFDKLHSNLQRDAQRRSPQCRYSPRAATINNYQINPTITPRQAPAIMPRAAPIQYASSMARFKCLFVAWCTNLLMIASFMARAYTGALPAWSGLYYPIWSNSNQLLAPRAGGAPLIRSVCRVTFWGALVMALTAGVGALFGVAA